MATKKATNADLFANEDWEEVAPRTPEHDFDDDPELIGVYVETKVIDVLDEKTGEVRPTDFYVFSNPDDEKDHIGVWTSGLLAWKWDRSNINAGDLVKIVYKGKQDIGNGRDARQYDLFVKRGKF